MITIMVFAKGATATLKQRVEVTVRGVLKSTLDGTVSFDLPAPGTYNVIVKAVGYQSWQGDLIFGLYTSIADVTLTPETPPATGYTGFCTIAPEYLSFGTFWQVMHPDLGRIKGGYSDAEKANYYAHIDERCFKRVPPPPTQEETITRNVIGRVQSQIDTAITNALAPVTGAIDALRVWIEEQIIAILLRALDREVEARGRNGRS